MLEQVLIFTRGGLVLWSCPQARLKGSPVDALIRTCLLEERAGDSAFQYNATGATWAYTLKWRFLNELGLVFVAVYQTVLHVLYVDELLDMAVREFSMLFVPTRTAYHEFDDTYRRLLKEAEENYSQLKRARQPRPSDSSRNGETRKKGGKSGGKTGSEGAKEEMADEDGELANGRKSRAESSSNGHVKGNIANRVSSTKIDNSCAGGSSDEAFDVNTFAKLRIGTRSKKASSGVEGPKDSAGAKKKKRVTWGSTDTSTPLILDFTDLISSDQVGVGGDVVAMEKGMSLMDRDDADANFQVKSSWLASLVGKPALERADLEPVLKIFKERLMAKNATTNIAESLCESVAASLVGKNQASSFMRVSSTVQAAMEGAMGRVLTPKRSVDVLREVQQAKAAGRAYTIVFVGVNGVGKSTNLAKVAYWLQQHGLKVMLAACDTFRSGAVEQLRTHTRRLQESLVKRCEAAGMD